MSVPFVVCVLFLTRISQRNFKLNKVKEGEENPKSKPAVDNLQSSIMDILARRQAIRGDSDDDWEDD